MDAAFDMQPENAARDKGSPPVQQRHGPECTPFPGMLRQTPAFASQDRFSCCRANVSPDGKNRGTADGLAVGPKRNISEKTCIWKRQPRPKRKDPSFPRETRSWNIGESSKRSRPRQIGAGWKASRRLNRSKSARHCSMPRNPTGAVSFDAGLTLAPV